MNTSGQAYGVLLPVHTGLGIGHHEPLQAASSNQLGQRSQTELCQNES